MAKLDQKIRSWAATTSWAQRGTQSPKDAKAQKHFKPKGKKMNVFLVEQTSKHSEWDSLHISSSPSSAPIVLSASTDIKIDNRQKITTITVDETIVIKTVQAHTVARNYKLQCKDTCRIGWKTGVNCICNSCATLFNTQWQQPRTDPLKQCKNVYMHLCIVFFYHS